MVSKEQNGERKTHDLVTTLVLVADLDIRNREVIVDCVPAKGTCFKWLGPRKIDHVWLRDVPYVIATRSR